MSLVSPAKYGVSPEIAQAIAEDVCRELDARVAEMASSYYTTNFQRWLITRDIASELFAVALAEGLESKGS